MIISRVRIWWVLLLALVALTRFWSLGRIPPGLNRDEAAIGYNAYSILKTGRDEYGKRLPFQLKSFGDWKLPLYPYLSIPFIRVLGLTQLAVRLPSAFFGWATVAVFPFFTAALLRRFKLASSRGEVWLIGMIAGIVLAFSPWQFHFSHLASEANLAVFLLTGGFWLFLKGLEKGEWFFGGILLMLFTLVTYHAAHVFIPLFLVLLLATFVRELDKLSWGRMRLVLALGAAAVFVGVFSFRSDRTKLAGLFILDQKSRLHLRIDLLRSAHRNDLTGRLFHNKLTFLARELPLNLADNFSPRFLLRSGGKNRAHNVPGFGNFFISSAVLMGVGVLVSFCLDLKLFLFLAGWSLAAALPSALTFDSPHTTRAVFMLAPLSLWAGIGGWWLWRRARREGALKAAVLLLSLWFIAEAVLFAEYYWRHFPDDGAVVWNAAYPALFREIRRREGAYERVVLANPERSPYIFLLFYDSYPPQRFQREVRRFPPTVDGFEHVRSFGRYEFVEKIDLSALKRGWLYAVPAKDYGGGSYRQLAKVGPKGAEFLLLAGGD